MIPDPEQERERLAHVYSGMTAEELENVADDAASLTDIAREALQTEITNRGLAIAVGQPRARGDVLEERELVSIRRFRDLPEALLAKGSLEASGIKSFLMDDNMVRMDWFISNGLGGVKLVVGREDAEAATALLDDPVPETLDVEGVGEYVQPRCPECQSLDVAYTSAWIGLPIPLHDRSWTCLTCGHHWEDSDPIEPSASEQP